MDLPPKNQRAVETLQDVRSALAGYLDAFRTANTVPILDGQFPVVNEQQQMMFEAYSDNIDFEASRSIYINPQNIHAQEKFYADKLLWNDEATPTEIWTKYYGTIGFLNALIDQMDDVKDGTESERKSVKGEMLAHRAYYFFKLLQYFAPYQNMELGIPMYLHTGQEVVGVKMGRKKQSEVYEQIIKDLTEALESLATAPPDPQYNVFYTTRYLNHLLAQVYWFKAESAAKGAEDYQHAAEHASKAIEGTEADVPQTADEMRAVREGLRSTYPAIFQRGRFFNGLAPMYGSPFDYLGLMPAKIMIEQDLIDLFSSNDIRKGLYFTDNTLNSGWPSASKTSQIFIFPPEEAYLILAEAYYHTDPAKSLQTLNKFKAFRNADEKPGLNGQALLDEIVSERRKEFFAVTDMRWLDLKRYANKTITRNLKIFNKDYKMEAKPNGYQYALQIPTKELLENKEIKPNEGWNFIIY